MIRELTPVDFDGVCELGKLYYTEAHLPGTLNPGMFKAVLGQFYEAGKLVAVGIFSESHELNGAIIGIASEEIYTGDLVGTMFCYYVRPAERDDPLATLLFRRWERMVAGKGVKRIQVGHLIPFNEATMRRLYELFGYRQSEATYIKILPGKGT